MCRQRLLLYCITCTWHGIDSFTLRLFRFNREWICLVGWWYWTLSFVSLGALCAVGGGGTLMLVLPILIFSNRWFRGEGRKTEAWGKNLKLSQTKILKVDGKNGENLMEFSVYDDKIITKNKGKNGNRFCHNHFMHYIDSSHLHFPIIIIYYYYHQTEGLEDYK